MVPNRRASGNEVYQLLRCGTTACKKPLLPWREKDGMRGAAVPSAARAGHRSLSLKQQAQSARLAPHTRSRDGSPQRRARDGRDEKG